MRFLTYLFTALLLGGLLSPTSQAGVSTSIGGNTATTSIDLLGVESEFILTFDDVDALSAGNLGISAQLVTLPDAALLQRLPSSTLTSLPSALPLLVTVEPANGTGFALRNTVRVEFHTELLPYTAGSHFRIFKAPLGGAFVDITDEVAPGSVRTRGTTGGFSQFLVLLDLRSTTAVINSKFDRIEARTADAALPLRTTLQAQLSAARAAVDEADFAAAVAAIDDFRASVSANAGSALSNQWTPSARNGNLAGDLLGAASSLKFSIGFLRDYGD